MKSPPRCLRPLALALAFAALLGLHGCDDPPPQATPPAAPPPAPASDLEEDPAPAPARARAEALLELLRAERWDEAAGFVDAAHAAPTAEVRADLGLAADADADAVRGALAERFQHLYGQVKPGAVRSVERRGDRVQVSYRHGDLDAFYLREVNGTWYYAFR